MADTNTGMLGKWYDDYMKTAPKPQSYTPVQATPTEWKADDSQSVAANVNKISTSGSPQMQSAETRAKQEMNARGMLNSSMAIGAGQKAVYDAALPIATADANINAQRGQFNANQATQTSQFNAGAQNESGQFNAQEANKADAARFDVAGKMQLQDQENASKLQLQDKAQADALARMAQQFKDNQAMMELQSKLADDNFPKQFAANFTTQMTDRVGVILADPNLDPAAKQAAVQNAIDFANTSLSWIGKMYKVAFPSMSMPGMTAPAPTPPAGPPEPPSTWPPSPGLSDIQQNGT